MHPACPASLGGLEQDPAFLVEAPGVRFDERLKDTELGPADAEHLADSIHHCEMVIHVSSSIGLDALVFDKPQIMVEFRRHHREAVPRQRPPLSRRGSHAAVHRDGRRPHREESRRSAGRHHAYLADPTRDREGRARGRVQQCDRLDGESGRRIGEFIHSRLPGTASRVAPGARELAAAARR